MVSRPCLAPPGSRAAPSRDRAVTWPVRTASASSAGRPVGRGELHWVRPWPWPGDPAQRQRLVDAVWRSDAGSERRSTGRPAGAPAPPARPSVDGRQQPVLEVPAAAPLRRESGASTPRGAGEEPLWTARSRYSGRVSEAAATAHSPVAARRAWPTGCGCWITRAMARRSSARRRQLWLRRRSRRRSSGQNSGRHCLNDRSGRAPRRRDASTARLPAYLDPQAPSRAGPRRSVPRGARGVLAPGDRSACWSSFSPSRSRRQAGSAYRERRPVSIAPTRPNRDRAGRLAHPTGCPGR